MHEIQKGTTHLKNYSLKLAGEQIGQKQTKLATETIKTDETFKLTQVGQMNLALTLGSSQQF